ncbi:hypothetical protein N7462_003305 [Penicillium macrosclerotiorum]|uniref:uncharacterized protein n=1 Tax=Penicillium macrosclerotiorum TaxID=303699 RepID=UPI0025466694|nr:uncharacterized protein N7462_003305 [Penicillium macrosclerotiorum]KAJ5688913.1 hypothetical protein N7462_003305 [Penicillium macrosclerotiorum]
MAQAVMGSLSRFSSTMRRSITSQTRNYASRTAIPTFTPTSSPELDKLLDRFRNDRFIPAGLPKRQRQSMFKEKHAQRLTEEPITVKISENEEYTFRPMKITETPTKRDAFAALQLMMSMNEWKNLLPFLSGLHAAGFRIGQDRWEQLVRRAGAAGKLSLILECARQGSHTGLHLRSMGVVRSLFYQIHLAAEQAGYKGDAVTKAFNTTRQAVDLMDQDPVLQEIGAKAENVKHQPFVIGTLLELSASRAINEFGAKDETNEVLNYARKLVASWSYFSKEVATEDRHEAVKRIQELAPVYNGLRQSLSIHGLAVDKDLHSAVTTCLAEAKETLQKQVDAFSPEAQKQTKAYFDLAQSLLSA